MSKVIHITPQELEDNYEYKVIKKIILREYPWIKNVFVKPEDLNQYRTLFLNFDVDPELLAKTYDFELKGPILNAIRDNKEYDVPFLSMFGTMDNDESTEIAEDIINLADGVGNSPAIPEELRLHARNYYGIGTWYYNRGKEPWF